MTKKKARGSHFGIGAMREMQGRRGLSVLKPLPVDPTALLTKDDLDAERLLRESDSMSDIDVDNLSGSFMDSIDPSFFNRG